MKPEIITQEIKVNGEKIVLESGRLANLADGAVLATHGETVVLATAVMAEARDDIDYFPLFVEYEERLYAGGIIKGSRFVKREGRPRDEAILNARLIDRSIRPLFKPDFYNETQVIVTVLSVDDEHDPALLGLIAGSAALQLAGAPWYGPVGATRMGLVDDNLIVNPSLTQVEMGSLDLVVSGTADHVVMVEAGANEVSEERVLAAIEQAQTVNQRIAQAIQQMAQNAGTKAIEYEVEAIEPELERQIEEFLRDLVTDEFIRADKETHHEVEEELKEQLFERFAGETTKANLAASFKTFEKKRVREKILNEGQRVDGRGMDEVRPLSVDVSVLPRTHGSALFQRGETQALTVATLGSTSLEQLIESMSGEETKRYIHHYNFPPFSTGETGRIGWPGRREVGHGALAERALEPMIPSEEDFPYTIRLVSEIMASNGSTSMAATCGSTLALMDAGVPIKKPVSGVAMGLVEGSNDYRILTDIQGIEDFYGDMDFKVAGTVDGITALQMDIKVTGLNHEILTQALHQAREARLHILERMLAVIEEPRAGLSKYAPKIETTRIDPKEIGEVIGPGGKVIRGIQEKTNTVIDVQEDGTVFVSGVEQEKVEQAIKIINDLTAEVEVGQVYKGTVTRVMDFGAFVEVLPGKEGLVHISELSSGYVSNVRDEVNEGDEIKVKVIEIDDLGRINLSRKALMGSSPSQGGGSNRGSLAQRGGRPQRGNQRRRPQSRLNRPPRRDHQRRRRR